MTSFLFLGKKFRHAGFIRKMDGKLAFVPLAAQLGTAVLKPCLYFLHDEKPVVHVPLPFPVAERLGIIAYQTVEGVHGFPERLAVFSTTYPLLATQTEQATVIHYQFAPGYTVKEIIHFPCIFRTEPLEESSRHSCICSPCSLFVFRGVSFTNNNRLNLCFEYFRFTFLSVSNIFTTLHSLSCYFEILLCRFGLQPVVRFLTELLCDTCKVNPAFVTVTLKDQVFAVHSCEFNQILFDSHTSKRIAIKEKAPVGVTVTTYVGRRESPVLSFRPP